MLKMDILSSLKMTQTLLIILLMITSRLVLVVAQTSREYSMDELSSCGRTLNVDDSGIRLIGRGNASPSNPPLECIIYLQSSYARDDGSNKIQIKVEALNIRDCNVKLDLFNGRASVGQTLQALSCQYSSTGLIYSTGREITVKFSRPDRVTFNDYQFTLLITPFKDQDVPGTNQGVDVLSVGAIIGIIIGLIVLVALIILFLWCCCTGRLVNLNVPGLSLTKVSAKEKDNAAIMTEKPRPAPAIEFKDPTVWNTVTTGKYEPQQESASRLYQRGVPRNAMQMGRRFDNERERDGLYRNYPAAVDSRNRRSGHEYEQYENDRRRNEEEEKRRKQEKKETLIDDVFDSDSAAKDSDVTVTTNDNEESAKLSPKLTKKEVSEIPEAMGKSSPLMQRYLSIDLQSQPDTSTISSPLHINAAVRASVEDNSGSPKTKRKKDKSPKTNRKGGGKEPDSTAMPPEAFEPIFTKPISGIDYKGSQPQYGVPHGYPGGFIPYGLIPAGAFAPGLPGSQTYAYAYQTVPPGGVIGQPYTQGAMFVQNTPTNEGNRRTAIAVEETVSPNKSRMTSTPETNRRKNTDPFKKSLPFEGRSGAVANRFDDNAANFSVITRGVAPPDPGHGHRSISMRSGTDPKNGIHTTQVVYTDIAVDPTDPKPNENPQITRKTVTRVTTKSGLGELPPQISLLEQEDEEPAFLSPSTGGSQRAIMPASQAPGRENVAFYSGDAVHHTVAAPERSITPTSVHHASTYSHAIRDRILLDEDSSV